MTPRKRTAPLNDREALDAEAMTRAPETEPASEVVAAAEALNERSLATLREQAALDPEHVTEYVLPSGVYTEVAPGVEIRHEWGVNLPVVVDVDPAEAGHRPGSDGGPESVVVLFARAMGEVGVIAKDRRIEEGPQKYAFRGIEDVQQRLQPILVRHGLVILPRTLERIDHPTRTTRSGSSMYAVALHVEFTVYGPAGDRLVMSAWGEGADTGDKSSGKAHSMAYKTAMLEAFCIPTEADTPDGDRTVPEDTYSDEQRDRAGRAWQAALGVTTEEALAGVRQRAAQILEVPVEIDGQTVPLEERLRGRLAYLRQQAAAGATPPAEEGSHRE